MEALDGDSDRDRDHGILEVIGKRSYLEVGSTKTVTGLTRTYQVYYSYHLPAHAGSC